MLGAVRADRLSDSRRSRLSPRSNYLLNAIVPNRRGSDLRSLLELYAFDVPAPQALERCAYRRARARSPAFSSRIPGISVSAVILPLVDDMSLPRRLGTVSSSMPLYFCVDAEQTCTFCNLRDAHYLAEMTLRSEAFRAYAPYF
jgi:hypothetical protein